MNILIKAINAVQSFWLLRCSGISIDVDRSLHVQHVQDLHRNTVMLIDSLRSLRTGSSKHITHRYLERYRHTVQNHLADVRDTLDYLETIERRAEKLSANPVIKHLYDHIVSQRARCQFFLAEIESNYHYLNSFGDTNVLCPQQSEQYHLQ